MSSISNDYDFDNYGGRGPEIGSDIIAAPDLQLINSRQAQDISKKVRDVHKVEKMTGFDWKDMLLSVLIVAAAIAAIIVGGHALFFGVGFLAAGLFIFGKEAQKLWKNKDIEQVHDDSVVANISRTIQKTQHRRQNGGRGNIEMGQYLQQGPGYVPQGAFVPPQQSFVPPHLGLPPGFVPAFGQA